MSARRLFLIAPDGTLSVLPLPDESVNDLVLGALSTAGVRWAEVTADSDGTIDLAFPLPPTEAKDEPETKWIARPPAFLLRSPPPAKATASRRRHKKGVKRRVRCKECGKLFTRLGIGPHMVLGHGKHVHGLPTIGGRSKGKAYVKLTPEQRRKTCPVCEKKFDVSGLIKHIKSKHREEAKAASQVAAADKERVVKGNATEQYLRDVVAGRRSIPPTTLGQAMADAAKTALNPQQPPQS